MTGGLAMRSSGADLHRHRGDGVYWASRFLLVAAALVGFTVLFTAVSSEARANGHGAGESSSAAGRVQHATEPMFDAPGPEPPGSATDAPPTFDPDRAPTSGDGDGSSSPGGEGAGAGDLPHTPVAAAPEPPAPPPARPAAGTGTPSLAPLAVEPEAPAPSPPPDTGTAPGPTVHDSTGSPSVPVEDAGVAVPLDVAESAAVPPADDAEDVAPGPARNPVTSTATAPPSPALGTVAPREPALLPAAHIEDPLCGNDRLPAATGGREASGPTTEPSAPAADIAPDVLPVTPVDPPKPFPPSAPAPPAAPAPVPSASGPCGTAVAGPAAGGGADDGHHCALAVLGDAATALLARESARAFWGSAGSVVGAARDAGDRPD